MARSSFVATGRCDAGAAVPYEVAAEGTAEERSRPWSRCRGAAQRLLTWCPGTTHVWVWKPRRDLLHTSLRHCFEGLCMCWLNSCGTLAPRSFRGSSGGQQILSRLLLRRRCRYSPAGCCWGRWWHPCTVRQGCRRRLSWILRNSLLRSLFRSCLMLLRSS